MRKPKILFWDIETTDLELAIRTYGLKNYTKYFNHKTIKRDWTMLGASWKFKGDMRPSVVSVKASDPFNDEGVVRVLYQVLQEADVLVGHNSDRFDLKKFNTRALHYGLAPLHIRTQQTVDTLKIAKNTSLLQVIHYRMLLTSLALILKTKAQIGARLWKVVKMSFAI